MDVSAALKKWREHGFFLEIFGHKLFVSEYGPADSKEPPILLLHGFPTASFDYARIVPLLAQKRRLILFDFLGFGYSDKPRPHHYSLVEQAKFAEEICARRGITEIDLLAHDMGSSVALILLLHDKLRVRKIVLLNGSILLKHYQPLLSQKLLLTPIVGPLLSAFGAINKTVFSRQFGRLFPYALPASEIDAFWSLITHNDGATIYHLLIRYLNDRKKHELTWMDALVAHRAPLLIMWGQRDPVSVPRIAESIVERRPDAKYIRLYELGHYPQWEAPVVISRETLSFLS